MYMYNDAFGVGGRGGGGRGGGLGSVANWHTICVRA